jgi:hypothetical protein
MDTVNQLSTRGPEYIKRIRPRDSYVEIYTKWYKGGNMKFMEFGPGMNFMR